MKFLWLIPFLLILLSREIFFLFLCLASKARRNQAQGPWDVRLRAQKRMVPHVYLTQDPLVETLLLTHGLGASAIIAEDLWKEWSALEREAFLIWSHCMAKRGILPRRLFGPFNPRPIDRDAVLIGGEGVALLSALEKTLAYRTRKGMTSLGTVLGGLSFLGSSLFENWPAVSERTKGLTKVMLKIQ